MWRAPWRGEYSSRSLFEAQAGFGSGWGGVVANKKMKQRHHPCGVTLQLDKRHVDSVRPCTQQVEWRLLNRVSPCSVRHAEGTVGRWRQAHGMGMAPGGPGGTQEIGDGRSGSSGMHGRSGRGRRGRGRGSGVAAPVLLAWCWSAPRNTRSGPRKQWHGDGKVGQREPIPRVEEENVPTESTVR
jgi:hypothetical protein